MSNDKTKGNDFDLSKYVPKSKKVYREGKQVVRVKLESTEQKPK